MITDCFNIRYNPLSVTSIKTFAAVKGGFNGNCKDVYFLRALGADKNTISDIKIMDETLTTKMDNGYGVYLRINALPKLVSVDDSAYYLDCYNRWIDSNKNKIEINFTNNNQELQGFVLNALKKTLEIFNKCSNVSSSIERNFVVKLLFWLDKVANKPINMNKKTSVKIVADNVTKKQEYLFYYMLTQVGFDVLLIQNAEDIDSGLNNLHLSGEFSVGEYCEIEIPKYLPIQNTEMTQFSKNTAVVRNNSEVFQSSTIVQKKTEPKKVIIPPKTNNNLSITDETNKKIEKAGIIRKTEKSFEELATLAKSVVMISIHNPDGEVIGVGSGIMIGEKGFILTNNHVAKNGVFYSVHIENDDNVYQTDDVIKYNPLLDLAVIRIDRSLTPIPVYNGTKPLVRGQKVVAIGSPLGLFNTVSDGIISGFRKKSNDIRVIQFTAPISSGSSGGAVLNMFGEVIGISTAGIDEGQNLNLAMDYNYINPFIAGFI